MVAVNRVSCFGVGEVHLVVMSRENDIKSEKTHTENFGQK